MMQRRTIEAATIGLILLALLTLIVSLGGTARLVVGLILVVGLPICGLLLIARERHDDEVRAASIADSLTYGTGIGVCLAVTSIVVMRHTPAIAEFITTLATHGSDQLSPAAIGFGYGVIFTIVSITLVAVALNYWWWFVRR